MTREEAVTGCDPTRDTQASWSSASPSPSPPFLSPGPRSPGPGPHHSQSRLCLLYLVLVTLISCAGQSELHMQCYQDVHSSFSLGKLNTESYFWRLALAELFSVLHIPELSYAEFISNYGPI